MRVSMILKINVSLPLCCENKGSTTSKFYVQSQLQTSTTSHGVGGPLTILISLTTAARSSPPPPAVVAPPPRPTVASMISGYGFLNPNAVTMSQRSGSGDTSHGLCSDRHVCEEGRRRRTDHKLWKRASSIFFFLILFLSV